MLFPAESIQIGKHRIALQMSGIADLEMKGIRVHTHDLGAHFVRTVGQINTVAQRLAHLCLAVGTGKTLAGLILRNQRGGLHQNRGVYRVELMYDFSCLLDHGQLILAYGNRGSLERSNIRCLADGIGEKSYGNTCFEVSHLNLIFYRRIPLKSRYSHQVHVIKGQLTKL